MKRSTGTAGGAPPSGDPDDQRPLGLWSAISLVVGNIIGSGLFLLPAVLAPLGGATSIGWAWSLTGALLLALVFARLAAHLPRAGGPYAYTRLAFGEDAGFLMAWSYWISCWCGVAAVAVGAAGSAGALFPELVASPWRAAATALVALWLATGVNLIGLRAVGSAQITTVIMKLVPLVVIIAVGLPDVDVARLAPAAGETVSWSAVTAAAALTMWAFQGLESASIPADQVTDAGRMVPRATWIGTVLAGVVTIAACSVVQGLVPPAQLAASTAPFADAAGMLWGSWGARAFAGVAVISCLGALNGWVLVQGQIPAAAARDGLFPAFFAPARPGAPPRLAVLISSVLATALVVASYSGSLVSLFSASILLATAAALLPYLASAAAALRLRGQLGGGAGAIAIAVGGLVYSAWALWGTGGQALRWFAGLMVTGVVVRVVLARIRRRVQA